MKFISVIAALGAVAVAVPTLEDRPLAVREPALVDETPALAARQNGCDVPGTPDMDVINTVFGICKDRQLNAKLMLATFETMRVESNYHNLPCGHADSIGVFQQRPSMQVWGNYDQIRNVPHSANAFIDALVKCYERDSGRSAGQLAQCAQISEIPDAYDRAEAAARQQLQAAIDRWGSGGGGGNGGASNVANGPSSSSGSCRTIKVVGGDTCGKVANRGKISVKTLHSLNPNINSSCSNLKVGQAICVQKTAAPAPAKPSNSSGGCKGRVTAWKGSSCAALAKAGGITTSRFIALNQPALNSKCTNLQANKSYCNKG